MWINKKYRVEKTGLSLNCFLRINLKKTNSLRKKNNHKLYSSKEFYVYELSKTLTKGLGNEYPCSKISNVISNEENDECINQKNRNKGLEKMTTKFRALLQE